MLFEKLVLILIVSLCLVGLVTPASAVESGTVGVNPQSNGPTITYNVKGLDFGSFTKECDGVGENYHFYEAGNFAPGEVKLWGTITNNHPGGGIDAVFYSAKLSIQMLQAYI